LDAVVLRTSDGARQVIDAFDRRRGEAVTVTKIGRSRRWISAAVSFGSGGGDEPPTCRNVATKLRHNARCPVSVALHQQSPCGIVRVYAIRREVPADEAARVCEGKVNFGDRDFFFLTGAELPIETFHEVQKTVAGEGRIRSLGLSAPSGVPLSQSLFDANLGASCSLAPTDAGLRCIPEGSASTAWLDPACSQRALKMSECSENDAPRLFVDVRYEGTKQVNSVLQGVGELRTVYTKSDTSCAPSGLGYAAVSVPSDTLAPGVYVVE
jgi:hypothetical protein